MSRYDASAWLAVAEARLRGAMNASGHWQGRLSSSALATAVAVFALSRADSEAHREAVRRGLSWLVSAANDDGGWGDSPGSPSNLSTTLLCWSALSVGGRECEAAESSAEGYLRDRARSLEADDITAAVLDVYGDDKTFSAPILAMCALAGRLGDDGWRYVPQLPFELAVLPRVLFRFLRLNVVSYALPALVAIGLLRHRNAGTVDCLRSWFRDRCTALVLGLVSRMQPESGGFLEAAPLTGFVTMSLAAVGLAEHEVTRNGLRFLLDGQRDDGSWAIDSDLATWLTSLSINALPADSLRDDEKDILGGWFLAQQMTGVHPLTGATGGGWGWTPRPGAVPDGDDTAGALLALRRLSESDEETMASVVSGMEWLLALQNGDGGMPTFCRGWGTLPFDRSCPALTAHALRAFDCWYDDLDPDLRSRVDDSMQSAVDYLAASQREDGSWVPLWFGSQWTPDLSNPAYGTAQTLLVLRDMAPGRLPKLDVLIRGGVQWLLDARNRDGGWGAVGGVTSSIEETSLALSALAGLELYDIEEGALRWLEKATAGYSQFPAAPIGLYFASLWYSEELYPLIFAVRALSRVAAATMRAEVGAHSSC